MEVTQLPNTRIYKFVMEGKVDEQSMTALKDALKNSGEEKINLLGIYKNFEGFESFKAFFEGVKLDIQAFKHVEKYALISDKKWVEKTMKLEDKILPNIQMKHFHFDEEQKAIDWLKNETL